MSEITLPNSIVNIGKSAFEGCSSLKGIVLPEYLSSIEETAFYKCWSLESINIPSNVKSIKRLAFGSSGLKSITFHEGLETIEIYAFNNTLLKEVNLPRSVTSVSEDSFYSTTVYMYADSKAADCFAYEELGDTISGKFISPSEPEYIIHKVERADGSYYLTVADYLGTEMSIVLPKRIDGIEVKAVEGYSFSKALKLQEVKIPDGYTHLKFSAFYTNNNLKTVYIPATVNSIHENALEEKPTIQCYSGSYAETWANEHSCFVELVDDMDDRLLGHTIIRVEGKEPSCTGTGFGESYYCIVCNKMIVEGDIIPATGHHWNEEYTIDIEATCIEEGSQSIHCSICGEIQEGSAVVIPKLEHAYGDWTITIEAGCEEEGARQRTCTVCGDTVTEVIPATGHQGGEAVIENKVDATCDTDGSYDEVIYCTVCGKELSRETKTIGAAGHQWNEDYTIDKEATCTEEGSQSIHCSICGEIQEGSAVVIPKLEHAYGDWTITIEAGCEEEGARQRTCTFCGDTVTEVIPATGHQGGEAVIENKVDATCDTDGSCDEVIYCTVCSKELSRETKTIAAAGHQWNEDYTIDKEATCSGDGSQSIHCSICGEIQEGSVVVIPKGEHAYGDWVVTKEATCEESGLRQKVCTACGDTISEAIPATGHILLNHEAVEADYDHSGNTEYWECERCGRYYSDGNAENEIEEDSWVIPKKERKYGHYTGLVNDGGTLVYLTDGIPDESYSGVTSCEGNWYYVKNGYVDSTYDGVQKNDFGWWAIQDGKVNFSFKGFLPNEYGWWYLENGKVSFSKNDIISGTANTDPNAAGKDGWWYVKEGKVTDETTVAKNAYGWWFVKNGEVDFGYNGVQKNDLGWWAIKDGAVDFSFNGFRSNEYGWWYLESGKVNFSKNDIISGTANTDPDAAGKDGWWYVKEGKVTDDTTVAKNANGWWFVRNGQVDFGYTGVQDNDLGWWAIQNGAVNFSYQGFLPNEFGWWYLESGKVSFAKNDIIKGVASADPDATGEEAWWYVKGSKVTAEETVAQNANGWFYIDPDGKVDFSYNEAATNENGTWYIKDGKVDFAFTGEAYNCYFINGKAQ